MEKKTPRSQQESVAGEHSNAATQPAARNRTAVAGGTATEGTAQVAGGTARELRSAAVAEARQRLQGAGQTIDESNRAIPSALHDTFLDERNDVLNVINELEDQLDQQQDVRERLERDMKETHDKLQAAQQRTQELEWQAVTLQTRVEALDQLRQEVTLLEEELGAANGRIQRLTEEQSRTEKEHGRLKNEIKAANRQLEELWAVRKERDGLRSDVKSLTARIEESQRAQRDLVDERGALAARLQEAHAALDEIRADRHQQQILLKAAEERTRELVRIQEELADKLETARSEKKSLRDQLAHLERENARMVEQRHFYETELAAQRNVNRTAEFALASVKKAFAEVRVALTETKARARRRMIETWPRIGIPLRGIDDAGHSIHQTGDVEGTSIGREVVAGDPADSNQP